MYNAVDIALEKPSSVYIIYKENETGATFRTVTSPLNTEHHLDMLLLKSNTEYTYQIVLDGVINQKSKKFTFKTREQSPWLRNKWISEFFPHEEKALGDGMVLICYSRLPGYIAIVDGKGDIRWYWQIEDIGVRAATLTPRGTILVMLRPPKDDIADDLPQQHEEVLAENPRPQRRGKMGFAGGTAIIELDLTGNILQRIDLNKQLEEEYQIIHHDLRMDKAGNIHTLYRPKKTYDLSPFGGALIDTLGGDGVLVIDPKGKVIKRWNVWNHWNIEQDTLIERFGYDRFHMNGLFIDNDENYLLSVPIEDQIWKVNTSTGDIVWKFGRNGDFKMDTSSFFSFQHAPYLDENGYLVLFDNGLEHKVSRTLAFKLDTLNRTAETILDVRLPKEKYTSRMGNGILLPNRNILQTSSKRGSITISDREGEILWELTTDFVPYRAEYIPMDFWNGYFKRIK